MWGWDLPLQVGILPLQGIGKATSSRRLHLLSHFGRVPGITLVFLWLVAFLKPLQVEGISIQRIRDTSSGIRFHILSKLGIVPGNALRVPSLVVILKPPPYTNMLESTFSIVLPCIFAHLLLQLYSWMHTYPSGLRGESWTPNLPRVNVWELNSQRKSKRRWNMNPIVSLMYYKCTSCE